MIDKPGVITYRSTTVAGVWQGLQDTTSYLLTPEAQKAATNTANFIIEQLNEPRDESSMPNIERVFFLFAGNESPPQSLASYSRVAQERARSAYFQHVVWVMAEPKTRRLWSALRYDINDQVATITVVVAQDTTRRSTSAPL